MAQIAAALGDADLVEKFQHLDREILASPDCVIEIRGGKTAFLARSRQFGGECSDLGKGARQKTAIRSTRSRRPKRSSRSSKASVGESWGQCLHQLAHTRRANTGLGEQRLDL